MKTINSKTGGIIPPQWHGQELARREALYQARKVPVYDWSDVKTRLDARRAALSRMEPHPKYS